MNEQSGQLGRFAEPSLYILVVAELGARHGYAIMSDVEAMSGSPLGPGRCTGRWPGSSAAA